MGENEFLPSLKPKYYPKIFFIRRFAQNNTCTSPKHNKEVITDYVKLSRGLINSRQKILMGKIILASVSKIKWQHKMFWKGGG